MELTMDITADRNWSLDWLDVGLLGKNFFCFFAKAFDFCLWKRFAIVKMSNLTLEV